MPGSAIPRPPPSPDVVLPKPWWRSRTILFNLGAVLLLAGEAAFGLLRAMLPGEPFALLGIAVALGNMWLRMLTVSAVVIRGVMAYDWGSGDDR